MSGPTQEQLTDADAAYAWLPDYLIDVAREHDWSEYEVNDALQDVDTAYAAADAADWWGADAEVFYGTLADDAAFWTGEGADELRTMFTTAAHTAEEVAAAEDAYGIVGMATGTAEGMVDDVEDYAEEGKHLLESPYAWGAAAAVGAVLLYAAL